MRWSFALSMLALPVGAVRVEQTVADELEEAMAASQMAEEMQLWGMDHQTLTARAIASCETSRSSCADGKLKERRATPTLLADDLVARLGTDNRIAGVINGWAAYQDLELLSVACERRGKGVEESQRFVWARGRARNECEPAECVKSMSSYCKGNSNAQLHLILPDYMRKGWSAGSPGWVMLLHNLPGDQYLLHGTDVLKAKENCMAKTATIFAHEYGDSTSSNPHVGVFVEWEEGCNFGTIMELAFFNGLGGYGGKSNWHEDKFGAKTWIIKAMEQSAPGMIQPWSTKRSELRVFDVPFRTQAELQAHFDRFSAGGGHSERKPRFRAVEFPATIRKQVLSNPVRLSQRSRRDILQALLNYIGTDNTYNQMWRMCQTFAADLYYYLTGERTTSYSKIVRNFYKQHREQFMYEPVD